ncbi:hypothetical protein O181_117613 [Austropuccinia psidii MF-1]|uniref:Integrase catalytic domain-containing protein n=1 Tax=Austropuccinia psidii MF-1 TaxID=1389203 RepID=A0A9Q3KAM5_9BASI|nr:hypothetical protein [Austropuccinia psidii MF-1]
MIHIQELSTPWEVAHMDWVNALSPGGEKSYNACLVIVDRYRKTPIFFPFHKDDTLIETQNLHELLGTKLSFSTAYNQQTEGLTERMIWNLEDMIRGFCAYGLEFKYYYVFTHDWCTLIPESESAYKISIHASIGKTPGMSETGQNPKLPVDTLGKDFVDIHPAYSSFNLLLAKVRNYSNQRMTYAFEYANKKMGKKS